MRYLKQEIIKSLNPKDDRERDWFVPEFIQRNGSVGWDSPNHLRERWVRGWVENIKHYHLLGFKK